MGLEELVEWISAWPEICATSGHRLVHVLKDICFQEELLSTSGTADSFVFATIGSSLGHFQ